MRTSQTYTRPAIGPQREPGPFSANSKLAGYPLLYNIEMDPHEDLIVGGMFGWVVGSALEEVAKYYATLKKYPNLRAPNITVFANPTGQIWAYRELLRFEQLPVWRATS